MNRKLDTRINRRSALTATAAGLAGVAVGGGVVAAAGAGPEPPIVEPHNSLIETVVLITGATSGIGKATAVAFAARGAKVFFCGRRDDLGHDTQGEIESTGGDATFHRADVREEAQVRDFVAACLARYGRIDVAFNNAGIETPRAAPLHEQVTEDWDNVQRTNARGVFLSMKYELPPMLAAGRGVIINNTSVSAEVGFATIAPYSASKHAILALTQVAALEYADKNIRVNAVAPGAVDTPMLRRAAAAFGMTYEQIAQDYPIKRIVAADEIARTVIWLASPDASAIQGADIDATGGYLAK
jgi:NAD(P)-dependent dehydrogenase (short-subunit alcohol dehydrogenase family)